MSVIEKAVTWMVGIANDESHGYDQTSRWGPDYDCSSLVISSYKQAGVGLTCTYTGNMLADMTKKGFTNVTSKINLSTGSGLERGDVLLNTVNHTAMYIGNGKVCEACGNENGGITGGKSGDQTGKEIRCGSYYNFPWNYVLRYTAENSSTSSTTTNTSNTYIVKSGDSLWSIAEAIYGSGAEYPKLMKLNNLTSSNLSVGQELIVSEATKTTTTASTVTQTTTSKTVSAVTLPTVQRGSNSEAVRALQTLLILRGEKLPTYGADGDFGVETYSALRSYQSSKGLTQNGVCDEKIWKSLIEG